MSDECRWGHGGWCMTHEASGSGICLKAPAALRAKVEELQATFDKAGDGPHLHLGCQRRERALEERVRELERQVTQTVEERESTVGELDALLREAREERALTEAQGEGGKGEV